MSDLSAFRDHARRMSAALHKPDCPHITARKPYWPMWSLADDGSHMTWNGPEPPWSPPACPGCITDADRALWARLADEADAYLSRNVDEGLFA